MDKEQKIQFVADLMKSVRDDIVDEVRGGKIPEEWTGLELREYLVRAFLAQVIRDKSQKTVKKVISDSAVLGLKY